MFIKREYYPILHFLSKFSFQLGRIFWVRRGEVTESAYVCVAFPSQTELLSRADKPGRPRTRPHPRTPAGRPRRRRFTVRRGLPASAAGRASPPHLAGETAEAQEGDAPRPAPPGARRADPRFPTPERSHFSRLSRILTLSFFLSFLSLFFPSGSDERKPWAEWFLIALAAAVCFLFAFSLIRRA